MVIRLHVVYAGRGDAMIIQDDDKLYLLDGGPLGISHGRRGSAPFYRYYMSSLRSVANDMGRPADSIKPDAVIVSHAHEDHFGGIQKTFDTSLSKTYASSPAGGKTLVFNGPFVTQRLPGSGPDLDENKLSEMLAEFAFKRDPPPGPDPRPDPVPGFAFAQDVGYQVYNRAAVVPPPPSLGRDWSVDTSPDNLLSVLMYHRTSKMVFTGDSAGYLIEPFVRAQLTASADPDKTLSVFKVPHHGSMRNSQRQQASAAVPPLAWRERGLLLVLTDPIGWDNVFMPAHLRLPGATLAAASVLRGVCAARGVSADALLQALTASAVTTRQNIEAGVQPPWTYVDPAFTTGVLWNDFVAQMELQAVYNAGRPGSSRKRARTTRGSDYIAVPGVDPSWFVNLNNQGTLSDDFLRRLVLKNLKTFYAEFDSWNYVISADGHFKHPAVETLAAIASVALAKQRSVRIFVTDGSVVDFSGIDAVADQGWRAYTEIRYLSRGARIVLDVTDPANARNIAALDPLSTTSPVASGFDLPALQDQFRRNLGATIPGRTLGDDTYSVKIVDQSLYLNLGPGGAISLAGNQQNFAVDDAWTLALGYPSPLPTPSTFDYVQLRGTVAGGAAPQSRLFRLILVGTDRHVLCLPPAPFVLETYVSADPATGYVTTNRAQAAIFTLSRTASAAGSLTLSSGPGVRSAATPLTTGTSTGSLREFLTEIGGAPAGPVAVTTALTQLVGPDNATELERGIILAVHQRILGWDADLDASTVTWTEDGLGPLVSAAAIAVQLATPLTFAIDDQQETIAAAAARLASTEGGPLTLEASVTTANGIRLDDDTSVAVPSRSRPIDQYLHDLGVAPASWPDVTIGTLLTAMLGAQSIAETLLMRAPSFIASAGIAQWQIDHSASKVDVAINIAGDSEVVSALIVAQTPAGIHGDIEGLTLAISDIALRITDARLPTQIVVLEATATVGTSQLAARSVLTDEGASLELSLPDTATLADLVTLLPGAPELGSLPVPLADQALSALSFSSPGIVLTQPVIGGTAYELAEVFGTVTFTGWESLLPTGWPAPTSSSLRARVFSPLDPVQRQVGVEIQFDFAANGKTFTAGFSAEPLADPTPTWAYTMGLWADPGSDPATVSEILGAVGLAGPLGTLTEALPSLSEAAASMAVVQLALTLDVPSSGPTTWDSIEIGLVLVGGWELVAGVIDLSTASVQLCFADQAWSGQVSADAILGGAHQVFASAVLPTSTTPGAVTFESSSPDLTLSSVIALAGLGDLASVPVVGTLLDVGVSRAELELVYESGASLPSIAAAGIEVFAGDRILGALSLSSLALSIDRRMLGPGSPTTSFWAEAAWDNAVVTLSYDGIASQITAAIRMTGDETIADMLSSILGTTLPNALLPLIHDFTVREGEIVLSSTDLAIQSFDLSLDNAATLTIGTAAISTLSMHYSASTATAPTAYYLQGTTTGSGTSGTITIDCVAEAAGTAVTASIESTPDTEGITAGGLLALLGLAAPVVPEPDGAPSFMQTKLTEATAQLDAGSQLTLNTLSVSVETPKSIPLLVSPVVTLEKLALHLDYDKTATPSTSGYVYGQVTIGDAVVQVRYSEVAGAGQFEASVQPAPAPDFVSLLTSGSPFYPGYALPSEPGLPSSIPMAKLTVVARPGVFIDVSGYADTTSWAIGVDDLDLQVTALGGHVRVTAPTAPGGATEWSVQLIGQVAYQGFVSTTVTFEWGPEPQHTLLTATATSPASAIQLPAIAGTLGGANTWNDTLPVGTQPIGFGDAAYLYLDLTAGVVALYGSLGTLGTGALLSVTRGATRSWVFVIGLAQDFTFGSLWSGLAPADQYLRVTSANAAVLAYDGTVADLQADLATVAAYARTQGIAFDVPFADLPAFAAQTPPTTALPQGLAVYAGLSLTDGTLSKAVGRIGELTAEPTILLAAQIDRTDPANTQYAITFKDFVLMGGSITVDGSATYRPDSPDTLVVAAAVGVALPGAESPYLFNGQLTVADTRSTFTAVGTDQPATIDPFGGKMLGITITSPALGLTYDYPAQAPTSSTITISGTVSLLVAGTTQTFQGVIYFVDGKPVVADVTATLALSVTDLFSDLIAPGGPGWPQGYEVLSLDSASIYYADLPAGTPQITIGTETYARGYNISADITLFTAPFQVTASLHEGTKGVIIRGSYRGDIDLGFVQLTPYQDPDGKVLTPGPTVSIDTISSPTKYEVACGISIFKKLFGWMAFTYQDSKYSATATYNGEIAGVTNPHVGLSYSEEAGLTITDWPLMPELGEILDFAKALKEASKTSGCGQLVGLVFDKTITTKFDLSMQQGGPVANATLPLKLTGTYSVFVVGTSDPLFTLPLPEIDGEISAPDGFDLDDLVGWITTTICANAVSIAKSLLNDMFDGQRAFKIFMAEFAMTYAGPQLLATLICDGADSKNVTDAADESVTEQTNELSEPDGPVEAVTTPAGTAASATTLGEAAAAFAAAVAALPALYAFVDSLLDLIEKAWSWLTGDKDEKKEEAQRAKRQGEEALAAARAAIEGHLAMTGQPGVVFDSPTSVTVTWGAGNGPDLAYCGSNVTYAVDVASDAGFTNVLGTQTTQGGSVTIHSDALAGSSTAYARVKATSVQPTVTFQGSAITGSASHPVPLPAPASVTQALTADVIEVTIAAVADATSYTVVLVDTAHASVQVASKTVPAPVPPSPSVTCTFAADDLPDSIAANAVLLTSACADGDPVSRLQSPFVSAPVSSGVVTTAPPTDLQIGCDDSGLAGSWTQVAGATGYDARVLDAQGAPLTPPPTTTITGTSVAITGSALVDGATLGVEVRPILPASMGLWSTPVEVTLHILPAPVMGRPRFFQPENEIRVAWSAVAGATGYVVEVTDGQGLPILAPHVVISGQHVAISGDAIVAGAAYRLQVRATAAGFASTWSEPLNLETIAVPAVSGAALVYADAMLKATWAAGPDDIEYIVDLEQGGRPVAHLEPTTPAADFGPASGVPLVPGDTYSVSIRGLVASSVGPSAVTTATVPTLLSVAKADHGLQETAGQAAGDLVSMLPTIGPAQLFYTLIAAGYPPPQAQTATQQIFPSTQLGPLITALRSAAAMAQLMTAEGVDGATIVSILAVFSRPPVAELAIVLKQALVPVLGVAGALSTAYSLSIDQATAVVDAVWDQPWLLGTVLAAAVPKFSVTETAEDLKAAYPSMLIVEAAASVKAGFDPAQPDVAAAIQDAFGATSSWDQVVIATTRDTSGDALAQQLHDGSVDRTVAGSYVHICWPSLSPEAVAAAISHAYDTN